jgi:hypothetical protein
MCLIIAIVLQAEQVAILCYTSFRLHIKKSSETITMASIDEQVEVLMSGTAYGDPEIKENMKRDLKAVPCASTAATTHARQTCTWDTRLPCGNCANFKNLGMMSPS